MSWEGGIRVGTEAVPWPKAREGPTDQTWGMAALWEAVDFGLAEGSVEFLPDPRAGLTLWGFPPASFPRLGDAEALLGGFDSAFSLPVYPYPSVIL